MFDCSKDVLSYHNDEVTLPVAEQNSMRERRDANRTRLKEGLNKANRPAPSTFETQGSYAMRTMIQLPGSPARTGTSTTASTSRPRISRTSAEAR